MAAARSTWARPRPVDRAARTVTTSTGRSVPYDALVLATGSYAFVPPVPGNDLPGCFVYRTLEDLEAIQAHSRGRAGAGSSSAAACSDWRRQQPSQLWAWTPQSSNSRRA